MRKSVKISLALVLFASAFVMLYGCAQVVKPTPAGPKEWTIMMFASADNDLESAIFANINQMEIAGSTDKVNMLAETDWWFYSGSSETLTNSGEVGVARWYITKDSDPARLRSQMVQSLPEINTGTAEAMRDFVAWAAANYPASHYMLIISSHGGGWRNSKIAGQGVGQDFTSDPTHQLLIDMIDMKSVMPSIYTALGKKLDIFAFDSCLMGMVEVSYQLKNYVDYTVVSEENVPGTGFPYDTIMPDLVVSPAMSPEALAKDIVTRYYEYYLTENPKKSTIAAIDVSKIPAVSEEVSKLSQLYDTADKRATLEALINSGTLGTNNFTVQRYYDVSFRDLWDMADQIIQYSSSDAVYNDITVECSAVKTAVENAVLLCKYTDPGGGNYSITRTHGLSIYFPTNATLTYEAEYTPLDFSIGSGWGNFVKNL